MAAQASLSAILTVFALAACLVICLSAESMGRKLGVMDYPDNLRKNHSRSTPLMGGIAILASAAIWLVAGMAAGGFFPSQLGLALLLPMVGVGLVGFVDDQRSVAPVSRILFILVFLAVAFVIDPAAIAGALNWGSFDPTPIPAYVFCALMALSAVGVVNAVNMADGQNGIVPGMFVIWSACLILVGDANVKALAEVLCGASVIVLIFNLRGKLFLGDSGAYGVTFVFGLATMFAYAEGRVSIETIFVWFFIPVVDCLRLLFTRPLRGHSPMEADHDHFHHRLQEEFGPRYGLIAYVSVVALSSLMATLAPHLALVCIIILTAYYFSFASLAESVAESGLKSQSPEAPEPDESGNVISLPSQERPFKRRHIQNKQP